MRAKHFGGFRDETHRGLLISLTDRIEEEVKHHTGFVATQDDSLENNGGMTVQVYEQGKPYGTRMHRAYVVQGTLDGQVYVAPTEIIADRYNQSFKKVEIQRLPRYRQRSIQFGVLDKHVRNIVEAQVYSGLHFGNIPADRILHIPGGGEFVHGEMRVTKR